MTFVIIGATYWVILMFCACVFRFPPPERNKIRGPIYRNGTLFITRKQLKYSSGHEAEKSIPPLGGTVGDGKIPGLGGGSIGGGGPGANNAYGGHGVAQNRIVFEPAIDLTLKEALTTYEYLGMYLMFLANLVSGLVILSRLADMCINVFEKSADTAATVVAINGGFNFVGRLMFSSLSDVIGRKPSYLVMLGTQVVILAVLPLIFLTKNYWAFLLAIWTLTCAYGGGFGTIPAFIHDLFGVNNISGLHGILLTAWSIAGVGGGILFTLIYNHLIRVRGYTAASPEVYNTNFYWLSACAAFGFIVLLFVRSTVKDRLLPRVGGEVTRLRIFGRILRFEKTGTFKFKLKYLKPEEEEKEWTSFWKVRTLFCCAYSSPSKAKTSVPYINVFLCSSSSILLFFSSFLPPSLSSFYHLTEYQIPRRDNSRDNNRIHGRRYGRHRTRPWHPPSTCQQQYRCRRRKHEHRHILSRRPSRWITSIRQQWIPWPFGHKRDLAFERRRR
jgi:MFS family permease